MCPFPKTILQYLLERKRVLLTNFNESFLRKSIQIPFVRFGFMEQTANMNRSSPTTYIEHSTS